MGMGKVQGLWEREKHPFHGIMFEVVSGGCPLRSLQGHLSQGWGQPSGVIFFLSFCGAGDAGLALAHG